LAEARPENFAQFVKPVLKAVSKIKISERRIR
jgi:hypothetical protein